MGLDEKEDIDVNPSKLLLPSLSVKLDHNLVSPTSWIQCRAPAAVGGGSCSALFQNLKHLLQHERAVHRIQHSQSKSKGSRAFSLGPYQLISLLRYPQVKLNRREVEDWLLEGNHGQRKRTLLQRREPARLFDKPSDQQTANEGSDGEGFDQDRDPDFSPSRDQINPELPAESNGKYSRPFKCRNCKASFARLDYLRKHKAWNRCARSFPFGCKQCRQHFKHRTSLGAHVRRKHSKTKDVNAKIKDKVMYPCAKCELVLPTLRKLQLHKVRHEGVKPFECAFAPGLCAKRFWTTWHLKSHTNYVHRKIRPGTWFSCDKCPKSFRTEETLKRHGKWCLMQTFEPSVDEPLPSQDGVTSTGIFSMTTEEEDMEEDEEPQEDPLDTKSARGTSQSDAKVIEEEEKDQKEEIKETPEESHSSTFILAVEDIKPEVQNAEIAVDIDIDHTDIDIKDEGTMTDRSLRVNPDPMALKLEPGEVPITPATEATEANETPATVIIEMPPDGSLTCPAPACGKIFARRLLLLKHIQRHNEAPGVCDFPGCGKVVVTKQSLELHMLTHTSETQFKCRHDGCGVGFKTWHGRQHHERRVHTGEFPFKCQYPPCERRFVGRQALQIHELRAHTKEKRFACKYCDKKCVLKHQLVEHERTHTGEKPLLCSYCGRGFARYAVRARHHQRHEAMMQKMQMKVSN